MRITLGTNVTRAGAAETITGLWTFANVLGLLTDIIGERTAAAGVTVDGLLIKDAGIPEAAVTAHEAALAILESQIADGTILARLAAAEAITGAWTFEAAITMEARLSFLEFALGTSSIYRARVTGDTENRLSVRADGLMNWGDGTSIVDTNLFRNAADELKTDDAFTVGAALTALGEEIVTVNDIVLTADVNNVSTGGVTCQRVTADSVWTIGGFTGGVDGRMIFVVNADDASNLGLLNEAAGSTAANRIILPGGATLTLNVQEGVWLMYDGTSSRWRVIAHDA